MGVRKVKMKLMSEQLMRERRMLEVREDDEKARVREDDEKARVRENERVREKHSAR